MMNSPFATPDIRKVASHPDGYILAVTNENEVFRSSISGGSWTKISTLSSEINCLVVSPQGTIYAGTNRGYFFSTDAGLTWEAKQIISYGYISDIEFNSLGYIFLTSSQGAGAGVWKSTDNGATWNKFSNGLPNNLFSLVSIVIDAFGNLYTLSNDGQLYKSSNDGYTWQLLNDFEIYEPDLKIDPNSILFISELVFGKIYKSTDLGNNWSIIYDSTGVKRIYIDSTNNIYALISLHLMGDHYFNKGIIFSSDGGNTWENIGIMGINIYDLIVVNNNIYAATDKGLLKSSIYNSNWTLCFKYNDRFSNVSDILVLPDGKILAGTNAGLYLSSNNGYSWDSTFMTSNISLIRKDNVGNIYFSSDKLYRSSDVGNNWEECLFIQYEDIVNFFINYSNNIIAATSYSNGYHSSILKSINSGISWDTIGNFYVFGGIGTIHGLSQNSFGSIFFSSYLLRYSGPSWNEDKPMIKTDNNGVTWSWVRQDLFIKNIYFFNDTIYLAASNLTHYTSAGGIYKSYNNGLTIISLNSGLENRDIKQIIKTPSNVLISVVGDGIYRSLNNGDYWYKLNLTGLPSTHINSVYYSDDGKLYACTDNGIGVFTGELPVEFTSFTVQTNRSNILLQWTTSTETNNKGFEIERKTENSKWRIIGFREGKGTTTEPQNYNFIDDLFEVNGYKVSYRLKQIDFNGAFKYSNVIEVELVPHRFSLSQNYPNPFNPSTKIKYAISSPQYATLKVYDVLGNEVTTLVDEFKPAGNYEVEFPNVETRHGVSLPSGVYFYHLNAGDYIETRKMILLR